MFGYITPEKTEMKLKDFYLYKAYYCGLCIASGKAYGQFSRFTTNYDFTFLNSLVHSYKNTEPHFSRHMTCRRPPISASDADYIFPHVRNIVQKTFYNSG